MRAFLIFSLLFVLCVVSVSGHGHHAPPPPPQPQFTMDQLQARLAELTNAQNVVNNGINYHAAANHPRRLALLQAWSATNQAEINKINGMIAGLSAGQPQFGSPPFPPVVIPPEATIPVAPVPVPVVASGYPYYPGYPGYNPHYLEHAAERAAEHAVEHDQRVAAANANYAANLAAAKAAGHPIVGSTPGGRPIVVTPGGRVRRAEAEMDAAEIDSADDADEESVDEVDEAEIDSGVDADEAEVDSATIEPVAVAPVPASTPKPMNRYRNHHKNNGSVRVTVNVNSPRHSFQRKH